MKLTTKILIGGALLIIFLYWLSFHYLGATDPKRERVVEVPSDLSHYFPETGIDLVYTWLDPNSAEYRGDRDNWILQTPEVKDDDIVRRHHRLFNYRGTDYMRFFLRSISDNVYWIRRLVVVIPDSISPSPTLNQFTKNPAVVVVRHSEFMPASALPTFNDNAILANVHKISNLTEEFVVVSHNTFFTGYVHLSQFRVPNNGAYVLPILTNSYDTDTKGRPDLGVVHSHALDNTIILNYKLSDLDSSRKNITLFDAYGAVLVSQKIMRNLQEKYPKKFNETTHRRFELKDDVCPVHLYLHNLYSACVTGDTPHIKCFTQPTRTYHVPDIASPDSISKLVDIATKNPHLSESSSSTAVYLADDVLKGNFRLLRPEFDTFFYTVYPSVSHLEIIVDDYSTIGLIIALFFSFGLVGICYAFTWFMGGNIKKTTKW